MKSIFLLVCMLVSGITAKAQVCDTVYRAVEHPATYIAGQDSLNKVVFANITSVINRCQAEGEEPPGKLYIELTIDYKGTVADVTFRKPAMSQRCEAMLYYKLIGLRGWKPARHKDQEVCSIFIIPVNCMK